MLTFPRVGILFFAMGLGSSCEKEAIDVKLTVNVATNQDDPVADAQIFLRNKEIGRTTNAGHFQTDLQLAPGSENRLEVRKDSEAYYFAPFFDVVTVGENSPQDTRVAATLYFVPKPAPPSLDDGSKNVVKKEEPIDSSKEVDVDPDSTIASNSAQNKESVESDEHLTQPDAVPEDAGGDDQKDSKPKIALTAVDLEQAPAKPLDTIYPKPVRKNDGQTIFTVHVFSSKRPVADGQIFIGQEDKGDLRVACKTNPRGRCVIRFPSKPKRPVTFVFKKHGFKTNSTTTRVTNQGRLRMVVERGQTIDVFAITKSYNYTRGLQDVQVIVSGKRVGRTDKYGHFSYVYTGKENDLVSIALKPKGFLPETFETDFVASGHMTLIRYFTPVRPPPVKTVLLKIQPAGPVPKDKADIFNGSLDRQLLRATRSHLYSLSSFSEYSAALLSRDLKLAGKTLSEISQNGWQESQIKADVDALLRPTILLNNRPILELSAIDSQGKVIAAAKESLDSLEDAGSIDRAVAVLTAKLSKTFPFEGAVTKKKAERVVINLGRNSGRGIKIGDRLDIYGVQTSKLGKKQTHKRIASLTITTVRDSEANTKVYNLAPRSTVSRGDLVVLRPRKSPSTSATQVRVISSKKKGVAQANVYLGDEWLGATDETGRLYVTTSAKGELKVIKHGFRSWSKKVTIGKAKRIAVRLQRETAFLRVESEPSGATVRVEGKVVGKTPLASPIPVPAGFISISIGDVPTFKTYKTVLELDQGTLDLTGPNAVKLEVDIVSQAQRLIANGKIDQAIKKLEEINASHSDYLLAQHELGELWLTVRDNPANAAKAFGKVTQNNAVRQFADKRFIGSHINEGIALFLTAENLLPNEPKTALAHYQKATEVLDRVEPQLRFVARDQYVQAVHNVDFYRALSRHKLWSASRNPALLGGVVRGWRSYLEGSAQSVPVDGQEQSYVENARVYFKQAQASLVTAKKAVAN